MGRKLNKQLKYAETGGYMFVKFFDSLVMSNLLTLICTISYSGPFQSHSIMRVQKISNRAT